MKKKTEDHLHATAEICQYRQSHIKVIFPPCLF